MTCVIFVAPFRTLLVGSPVVVAGEGQAQAPSPFGMLLPVVLMIAIFYFLLIRPQRKYQRERQAMIQALKKHDHVLTRGGIYGTVVEVRPGKQEIVVEIAKNTRVRMARSAVEAVVPKESQQAKEQRQKNR